MTQAAEHMKTPSSNSLIKISSALLVMLCVAGCYPMSPQPMPKPKSAMVGHDRDSYGCIPSAGYSYCAKTQRCERPWELAQREHIVNSGANIAAWCNNAPYQRSTLNQLPY